MRSSVKYNTVVVLSALFVCSLASPIFEPIFAGLSDDSQWDTKIVKRNVVPENTDGALKQVSLQSLIGGLEHSLVRSAISVSSLTQNKDAVIPEVIPSAAAEENHAHKKRHTETTETNQQLTSSTETPAEAKGLILQTTEQVPLKNGLPAHIIIDRVTVQEHSGDLPFIPPFEVKHTKLVSATLSAGNATEISITKTTTTSTSSSSVSSSTESPATLTTKDGGTTERSTVLATDSTSTTAAKTNTENTSTTETTISDTSKTTTTAEATTSASTTSSSTTKTPIVKLKEAEEELKEKVAEIEADPVILSTRI